MSIFRKLQINAGDLVVGVHLRRLYGTYDVKLKRFFDTPALVLEIKEKRALVYFEQSGPKWYDIDQLEKVYVNTQSAGTLAE